MTAGKTIITWSRMRPVSSEVSAPELLRLTTRARHSAWPDATATFRTAQNVPLSTDCP
jgi:hypothetical protein